MKDTFDFCKDMNKVFKNYDVEFVPDKDDVEDSVTVLVDAKNPKIVAEYIYNNHFKGVKDTNVGVDGNKVMLVFYNFSEYSTDEIERLVSDAIFDANARYNLFEGRENKNMKKSITEKFNAPKDWDFDEMVEEYGEEYLNEVGSDWEDYVHDMDDLEYYLEKEDLNWLLNRMYYGGQYIKGDFSTKETFDPNEEYYVVNAYGNFYSLSEYYKNDFIKDKIEYLDDGEESFYDWCVEQGYFESEEDEE